MPWIEFSTYIIDELVKSGKEIEAIYFAFELRFPPVSLLKSYLSGTPQTIPRTY